MKIKLLSFAIFSLILYTTGPELLNQLLVSSSTNGGLITVKILLKLNEILGNSIIDINYREENCWSPNPYFHRNHNTKRSCSGGQTPLIAAIISNQPAVARLLLDYNASKYIVDLEFERFPIEYAIIYSQKVVDMLLDNEDFKNQNYAIKALTTAANEGDFLTFGILHELGAVIDHLDNPVVTYSPLIASSYKGHTHIVQYIIDHGEISLKTAQHALFLASQQGNTEIVRKILVNYVNKHQMDIKLLLEYRNYVSSGFTEGFTPLISASQSGRDDTVLLLLLYGADVEAHDNKNFTSLHHAAKESRSSTLKLLVDEGHANINKVDGEDLRTPIGWSALRGDNESVKFLIRKGSNIDHKDKYGRTPLSWTTRGGYYETAEIIGEMAKPSKTDIEQSLYLAKVECWAKPVNCNLTRLALEKMLINASK